MMRWFVICKRAYLQPSRCSVSIQYWLFEFTSFLRALRYSGAFCFGCIFYSCSDQRFDPDLFLSKCLLLVCLATDLLLTGNSTRRNDHTRAERLIGRYNRIRYDRKIPTTPRYKRRWRTVNTCRSRPLALLVPVLVVSLLRSTSGEPACESLFSSVTRMLAAFGALHDLPF